MNRSSRLSKNLTDIFGSRGRDECRVCANPLSNPRRKYCCDRCQRIAYRVIKLFRWPHVRAYVQERDDHACVNPDCENDADTPGVTLHVDHVHPLVDAGPAHDPANLQTLCDDCNLAKGDAHTDYRPDPMPDGGYPASDSPEAAFRQYVATERAPETPPPVTLPHPPSETHTHTDASPDPAMTDETTVDVSTDVSPADVADDSISLRTADGKTLAAVADLQPWADNPRKVQDPDIDRLQNQLETLGQYKPLLVAVNTDVVPDGTVVGGNMRIQAVQNLDWDEVWVSLLSPEDEDELVEYALSDNDRIGYYDDDQMAALLTKETVDVDVARFKPDFYPPSDLAQNMATAMDPEELIAATADNPDADPDQQASDDASGGDATSDPATDDTEPPGRNIENLGQENSTAMVQLIMAQDEKHTLGDRVDILKREYGLDTTSEVVQEAIRREYDRVAEEYDEEPSVKSSTLNDQLADAEQDD